MISLITISLRKEKTFVPPGVGTLGFSHAPVPSGKRARGVAATTTASCTDPRPGEKRNSREPGMTGKAKPSVALVRVRNPPGFRPTPEGMT
jgi:hypothetical protein